MDILNIIAVALGPIPIVLFLGLSVFATVYSYNEKILNWLHGQSIGIRDHILSRFQLMFIEKTPNQILLVLLLTSFGNGALVLLFFGWYGNWFAGALFSLIVTWVGWKAPKVIIDFLFHKRIKKFNYQLIDALGLMSNALKSGLSVQQSLSLVVEEMPNPVSQEFNLLLNQTKLGVPLEEAFISLSERIPSEDVQMFVSSVVILKETGGNLADAFDNIVYTIRERIKIEKKIDAMTAMGKTQGATLFFMPPVLGIALYIADPNLMTPVFTHPVGILGLLVVIGLQLGGGYLVIRLTQIDV